MTGHRIPTRLAPPLLALLLLGGCASSGAGRAPQVATAQSEVEQRDYQTRAFDTSESDQTMRVVIATLQDLGFIIDHANATLGAVSATRPGRRQQLRITVTVRPRGTTQVLVRANAHSARAAIRDPRSYQQFFAALEKAMFLKAHEVD